MVAKIRRVITGHNLDGRSVIVSDGKADAVKEMESMPGLALTDLWETRGSPADNTGNGTLFRMVEFPPDSAWQGKADPDAAFRSIGAGHASDSASDDPMMHMTSTVDYLIVIKGEIWAIVDEGEVCLKPGDVMVQRGTNHSWSVRTDEPCLLAAVLVNAAPV